MSAASAKAGTVRIGCPAWAHEPWRGRFFTTRARREEFLRQYAGVFGTTEGNATFYGVPPAERVARWAAEAPAEFRFCFKFPRAITHDRLLVGAETETREFLTRLAPLAERLGPYLIQLHERFDARRLGVLEAFLRGLPREFAYAVEVRAPEFYAGGAEERALDALLGELGMDRSIFDTRCIHASTATDEFTRDAQRRKPRLAIQAKATGRRPFVRFVADPQLEKNTAALAAWAEVVAAWRAEGREPYFFTHHPDDTFAPDVGRMFQASLRARCPDLPEPPRWPAEGEPRAPAAEQLSLL